MLTCDAKSKVKVLVMVSEMIFLHFFHIAWQFRMVQAKKSWRGTSEIIV